MKRKYLAIGAWVGSIISIANLIKYRDQYIEAVDDCGNLWWVGGLIGAGAANMINMLLWPVSLAFTLYKYIRGE